MGRPADIRTVGIFHPSIAVVPPINTVPITGSRTEQQPLQDTASPAVLPVREWLEHVLVLRTRAAPQVRSTDHTTGTHLGHATVSDSQPAGPDGFSNALKKPVATRGMSPPPPSHALCPYPHSGPVQPSRSKPESSLQPVMATKDTSSRRTAQKAHCERDSTASHEQGFDAPPGPLMPLVPLSWLPPHAIYLQASVITDAEPRGLC